HARTRRILTYALTSLLLHRSPHAVVRPDPGVALPRQWNRRQVEIAGVVGWVRAHQRLEPAEPPELVGHVERVDQPHRVAAKRIEQPGRPVLLELLLPSQAEQVLPRRRPPDLATRAVDDAELRRHDLVQHV